MKELIFSSPLFGLCISILTFALGTMIQQKTKKAYLNPLLISYVLIISFLLIFHIPFEWYMKGGELINIFLGPATCALALNIYRQWETVKKNALALLVGTLVGSATSMTLVYFGGKLLGLQDTITFSLVPKGITTPMAMAVSENIGGIQSLTVIAVIVTGVTGNVLGPMLLKVFHFEDPVEQGIALGTSAHAIGTSKASEIGEVQAALSSVALTLSGIVTVLLSLILF